jgi:hypothetical protein
MKKLILLSVLVLIVSSAFTLKPNDKGEVVKTELSDQATKYFKELQIIQARSAFKAIDGPPTCPNAQAIIMCMAPDHWEWYQGNWYECSSCFHIDWIVVRCCVKIVV